MLIKIFGAYPWTVEDEKFNQTESNTKNKFSPNAIKTIIDRVSGRITDFKEKNPSMPEVKLFYSRLRATSGTFVLNSIRDRMKNAYAVIFDITGFNPNVILELGIALELQQQIEKPAKVFLISCSDHYNEKLLPSDIRGYFLTTYQINEKTGAVKFGDYGSLEMRITSDIIEMLNISYIEQVVGEQK